MSAIAWLAFAAGGRAADPQEAADPPRDVSIDYPAAKRIEVAERHFGETMRDPFRWVEHDPVGDRDVAAWIAAQRRTTRAYLDKLPGRAAFRDALTAAYDHERVGAPQKAGGRYFFTRRAAGRDQAALYLRGVPGAGERKLLDPVRWSADGSAALAEWRASPDGGRVAYAVQTNGSDWRTIRVTDVASERALSDEVRWARFTQIAWANDGSGFYYSRYPGPMPTRARA